MSGLCSVLLGQAHFSAHLRRGASKGNVSKGSKRSTSAEVPSQVQAEGLCKGLWKASLGSLTRPALSRHPYFHKTAIMI
eukprot:1159185-Pelagomonas_calceolata.AAC.17